MGATTSTTPWELVVRFSSSTSDLTVAVADPVTTSVLSLQQQIRCRLPPALAHRRLRLIHAGKVLSDHAALTTSLHVTPPPPKGPDSHDALRSAKAQGKQPVRDLHPLPSRVYIHCSVGDTLDADNLAHEAQRARDADVALAANPPGSATPSSPPRPHHVSTTQAPRGFDRLLATGFTAAEVAALRSRFLAVQAHTHTPATMPAGADLLALEERWLDHTAGPAGGRRGAGGTDTGGFGSEDVGGLEDLLYGHLMGFFWPLGAVCWLMREEGVWSRRRQIAVLSGFLVNLLFGFIRMIN